MYNRAMSRIKGEGEPSNDFDPASGIKVEVTRDKVRLEIAMPQTGMRLVSTRADASTQRKSVELPGKKIKVTPVEFKILKMLGQEAFSEETEGVDEAGHSLRQEKAVKTKLNTDGGIVGRSHYWRAIHGVKERSKVIKPEDIAKMIIRTRQASRSLAENDVTFIGYLAALTGVIQEYWDMKEDPAKTNNLPSWMNFLNIKKKK